MIGIVCSIFTVFGLFSTIFSKDAVYVVVFEVVYLVVDAACLVCLFIAVLRDKKVFLIPFFLSQVVSILFCAIFALLCIWALIDTDNYFGTVIKEIVTSAEEIEMERLHPEMAGKMIIRLTATFLATASILFFCLTFWWLVVVHRCYQYYSDMEKHRDPLDPPVAYNTQQGVQVY